MLGFGIRFLVLGIWYWIGTFLGRSEKIGVALHCAEFNFFCLTDAGKKKENGKVGGEERGRGGQECGERGKVAEG